MPRRRLTVGPGGGSVPVPRLAFGREPPKRGGFTIVRDESPRIGSGNAVRRPLNGERRLRPNSLIRMTNNTRGTPIVPIPSIDFAGTAWERGTIRPQIRVQLEIGERESGDRVRSIVGCPAVFCIELGRAGNHEDKPGQTGSTWHFQSGLLHRGLMDILELRPELHRWVREIAGQRTHGTTGKRPLKVFEEEEQSALLSLPVMPSSRSSGRGPRSIETAISSLNAASTPCPGPTSARKPGPVGPPPP